MTDEEYDDFWVANAADLWSLWKAAKARVAELERVCAKWEVATLDAVVDLASANARIRTLEASLAEREWQPIETAPKNIPVQAFLPDTDPFRRLVVAEWDSARRCWCTWGWSSKYKEWLKKILNTQPTHWQPLPAGPEVANG